jgi:hypothetical protein
MTKALPATVAAPPWLLLLHQLPPKPAYFRVRIWRRLHDLGAVAIKNSVYVLPAGDETREDFEWLLREIADGGGEACICEARMIDGLTDQDIRAQFDEARDADYREIADEARAIADAGGKADGLSDEARSEIAGRVKRLRKRLAEVVSIDFFGAGGRETAEGLVAELEARLRPAASGEAAVPATASQSVAQLKNKTWVTRRGVHIDRMASAWLVRRFIDPDARFKFVGGQSYRPVRDELRFDMFEAEFTHDGDRCTFEVLLDRATLDDPALRHIAEIVHDIDIKDRKFERPEASGIAQLIAGIAMAHDDDADRLERSAVVFDDLLTYFRRKRRAAAKTRKEPNS